MLLIAAVLTGAEVLQLGRFAKSLGLEVLLEIHDAEELEKTLHPDAVSLVGVNNRNLHDFSLIHL